MWNLKINRDTKIREKQGTGFYIIFEKNTEAS